MTEWIIAALAALAALVLGANVVARPQRGKTPGRPQTPPDPPKPDTEHLTREESIADHTAAQVQQEVAEALDTEEEHPGNPHGLADTVNRRRRR